MMFRFGLKPDDGRHPRKSFADMRARLSGSPQGGADLTEHAGPVLDQNNVGWCTVNTLMAAATTLKAAGTPLGFIPSQRVAYQLALRLDRADDYPLRAVADMPRLRDVGSQLLTMVEVGNRYGVCPMGPTVKVDGYTRMSDCSPANATDDAALSLADVETSATRLLVGAYELDNYTTRKTDMMMALDGKHSLSIGGFVDTVTYMWYRPGSSPIGAQVLSDPNGGGHCTELLGYKFEGSSRLWKIKGSWSEEWGHDGYGWVTDAFVDQLWAVFCMSVEVR